MVTWKPIGARSVGSETDLNRLPGLRGRRLIYVPDLVPGRYVHFSWREESFCVRDYIGGREARQEPGLTATDVWRMIKGPIFQANSVPYKDTEFWKKRLQEVTDEVLGRGVQEATDTES